MLFSQAPVIGYDTSRSNGFHGLFTGDRSGKKPQILITTNEHLNSAVELAGTVPLYGESTRKADVHTDLLLHVETQ